MHLEYYVSYVRLMPLGALSNIALPFSLFFSNSSLNSLINLCPVTTQSKPTKAVPLIITTTYAFELY